MRPLGFALSSVVRLREAKTPDALFRRPHGHHRRRLDDVLETVFHSACASNNLDSAADVLAVLEKWHERRAAKYGRDRRIESRALTAMRVGLERLTASRMS
jgi:hypothetical protein